jgi:beta-lactamase superfamily II metal-dependent hydrolase
MDMSRRIVPGSHAVPGSLALHAVVAALVMAMPFAVAAKVNGKLQVHFLNAGQADAILVVSPGGQTVLIDGGIDRAGRVECSRQVAYLAAQQVRDLDYVVTTHYHEDHLGCTKELLEGRQVKTAAYDRGGSYTTDAYDRYVAAVGTKRATAAVGTIIKLDDGAVWIETVAANGNGEPGNLNENDKSLAMVLHYGKFDAVLGGDLSGVKSDDYEDIESRVLQGDRVGRVEAYKVNHHCSRYSSNTAWMTKLRPRIGVIQVGNGNDFGHPSDECVERLHTAGVHSYWLQKGSGRPDKKLDEVVNGPVVVQVSAGGAGFDVTARGNTKTYVSWDDAAWTMPTTPPAPPAATFVWSTKSRTKLYHSALCPTVASISEANRLSGPTPPAEFTGHTCVEE